MDSRILQFPPPDVYARFNEILRAAIEKAEAETGESFCDLYEPLHAEEFTDIRWTAIQMLVYWSDGTGEPFQRCVNSFLDTFLDEVEHLKAQGFPEREGPYMSLEHPLAITAKAPVDEEQKE